MSLTVYRDDSAWIAHGVIVKSIQRAEANFLRMGEKLYEVVLFKYYKTLGYSSFGAYCASIGISKSFGYGLAQIHELFVLRAECPPAGLLEIGTSKLALLAPRVDSGDIDIEDEETLESWLFAAETLSRSDLITDLKAAYGDDAGDTVPWRRKAALWKALAKKYYRFYRKGDRKWLQQRKSSRNE